jgi:hypothetical protein
MAQQHRNENLRPGFLILGIADTKVVGLLSQKQTMAGE